MQEPCATISRDRKCSLHRRSSTRTQAAGGRRPSPVLVVGLPRSGWTLVEQILSSHSAIEGTMELSDILSIAERLGGKRKKGELSAYPEVLSALSGDEMKA